MGQKCPMGKIGQIGQNSQAVQLDPMGQIDQIDLYISITFLGNSVWRVTVAASECSVLVYQT